MSQLSLPPHKDLPTSPVVATRRQISIIGANGAGKTRFMRQMQQMCGDRAYSLSALHATFPERSPSTQPGSIDAQYAEACHTMPHMRSDAVCELDKLCYLLFADEFQYLLSLKAAAILNDETPQFAPTRLDKLIMLWERIFPGNQVLRQGGKWMFKTDAGNDIVTTGALSQGEKAVLYYIGAVLYAPKGAVVFIEAPTLFLHPSILNTLWNNIENLRPDCTFVYNSVDVDFVRSRTENTCIWVKSFDVENNTWDYEVLNGDAAVREDIIVNLVGSRRPVLFIEGDATHSIDAKLYTLVYPEYTVRPLGSCNKVIEAVRAFNDLNSMHHLESHGIVDRDRRTAKEVEYLRLKQILVPEVAEVENIFLMEKVIRIMARYTHRDPDKVFSRVKKAVLAMFASKYQMQALQHVRHTVKRDVECKIDARFTCITALETHLRSLVNKLRPRDTYNALLHRFEQMLREGDYDAILQVFNHKPMLPDSNVAELLGFANKDAYIAGVLSVLKGSSPLARELRQAIRECFSPSPSSATAVNSNAETNSSPSTHKKKRARKNMDEMPEKPLTPRQKRHRHKATTRRRNS